MEAPADDNAPETATQERERAGASAERTANRLPARRMSLSEKVSGTLDLVRSAELFS